MVEVIDLLSSSPPKVEVKSKTNGRDTLCETAFALRSSPRQRAAAAAMARQKGGSKYLNSDPFRSSPPEAWQGKENVSIKAKVVVPCGDDKVPLGMRVNRDGFLDLSSDIEEDPFTSRRKSMTGAPADENGANSNVGQGRANETKDFFFLSDDFDSTVNLDDSFAFSTGVESKKRKLTPDTKVKYNDKKLKATTGSELTVAAGTNTGGFKRTISDITHASKATTEKGRAINTGLRRSRSSVMKDDPILFTSSPDVLRTAKDRREKWPHEKRKATILSENDDPFVDIENPRHRPISQKRHVPGSFELSSDTDLPDLTTMASRALPSLSRAESARTLEAYKTSKVSDQKARDKSRLAADKAATKEAEKERKRLAKEEKARGKQAAAEVAKVNTLRIDKKVSTPEMIVDLPTGLDPKIRNQVNVFLGELAVQVDEWDCTNSVKDVIRWRRKVEAKYNDEIGYWEPTAKHIRPEKHVMCIMQGKEFVELTCADEGKDLDSHVLRMKAKFGDCAIIYLVEGLAAYMRKSRTAKNRQFAEAVRSQAGQDDMDANPTTSSTQKKRGKAKEHKIIDEDMIEDSLLKLQVVHGILIHHTGGLVETAQWIVAFTQHISTIPYRHQRMTLDTAFCMESGQVKTGDSAEDTFVKMLQEVNRITAPIAYGIASEYPSVQKLVKGFESGASDGKDLLQTLKKSANKDGAFTDREIGKRVSRRVWNIFMSREEGSTDI